MEGIGLPVHSAVPFGDRAGTLTSTDALPRNREAIPVATPLKLVHIGAGGFSRTRHAPTLQHLAESTDPPISLEAICDLDRRRAVGFCESFGYKRAYTDLDAMIQEVQPQVIVCTVQPPATAPVLERLLPLGLPIFTEKPPGVTLAQAERLGDLAEEHGVVTYVGFNRRRAPGIERLKRWSLENGPVRYIRAEMLRNRRLEPEFGIGTAIHALDCLRYLGGEVEAVETVCRPYEGTEARDFLVRLHFAGGFVGDLAVLVDCGLLRERYLIHTTNACMETTLAGGYSSDFCKPGEVAYRGGLVEFDDPAVSDWMVAGGFLGEHQAFLEAVHSGKLPDCCLQDGRRSVRLAVAVHEEYSGPMEAFAPTGPDPYVRPASG